MKFMGVKEKTALAMLGQGPKPMIIESCLESFILCLDEA